MTGLLAEEALERAVTFPKCLVCFSIAFVVVVPSIVFASTPIAFDGILGELEFRRVGIMP
jgi:hypothetical protein